MHVQRRLLVLSLAIVAALSLVACRGGTTKVDGPFSNAYPTYHDKASGITAILGTPDLGVGTFRVAIALNDEAGLIRFPALSLRSFAPGSTGTLQPPAQEVNASFYAFPDGSRGLYTASMTFDRAGAWSIVAAVPRPSGTSAMIVIPVTIAEHASAPVVGATAPASKNRIAKDVPSLDRLTTGSTPDPALYQHRIADSRAAYQATVVVFASPAFCTTPLCGPQVEDASDLVKTYGDRVDVIHVDLFQNPQEIKGDLSRAVRSPLLAEWGLHTDEWTFVIDGNGTIAGRFEAYAPRPEVDAAIRRSLGLRP
ncbi:MAG: hypothetical protein WCL53_07945 [Chloroflexota bacterium]